MRRLPAEPPHWVRAYLDIPFVSGGRDSRGIDCWGLARLVYAEQLGVILPTIETAYGHAAHDHAGVSKAAAEQAASTDWQRVETPGMFDVVLTTRKGQPNHVGTMVAQARMLHIESPILRSQRSTPKIERIDGPAWSHRIAGFYRFTGGARLIGKLNPFEAQRIDQVMPAGMAIADMLKAAGIVDDPAVRVSISGKEVPRERWSTTKPLAGRQVQVSVAPLGGGDGNSARIVFTIGVLALAIAAPYSAPAVGAGLGAGTLGGSLLSAGIMIGGTLLVNAIVPPMRNRLSDAGADTSRSQTITGGQNRVRKYAPVPVILGTHRVTPDYGALPYTEAIGDDQYLRALFVVGYGPLAISELKIGDTPIEDFEGVEVQVRPGYFDDAPITIYPGVVVQNDLAILLTQAGSWQSRTSDTAAAELSVDVTFPNGLAVINPNGSLSNASVALDVEYAVAGSGTWVKVNGDAGSTGSPTTERMMDFLFRTPEVNQIASGYTNNDINWSYNGAYPDAKPGYLPSTRYSWQADAWLYAPTTGTYTIGIDSSDASDVQIDGTTIASFYGSHGFTGTFAGLNAAMTPHSATVALEMGWHAIRVRMEARSTGGGVAVAWKKPGDANFSIIPSGNLKVAPNQTASPGYNYRAYDLSYYTSSIAVTANRLGQIRRSLAWAVPTGQYDVRIRRTTADASGTNIIDQVYWTALRTIRNQEPINLKGLARIALRIKATDQLNGVVDQFNCMATSILNDWDATEGAWVKRGTSNPASCYRAILQHRANKRALADSRIDLTELQAWHAECVTRGLECNAVLDFAGTVYERLSDVAATGRASFGMRDGLYSVVRDRVQTTPSQHFTPHNSWGFTGSKAFPDIPHAIRVRFLNRETGYQEDERVVYADGYSAAGGGGTTAATRFEELQTFGCTDKAQAWKHGRYFWAVGMLRPEVLELSCDFEHLTSNRGDLVLVSHDVPLWGLGSGRVISVQTDGSGNATGVTIDNAVPMETGTDYRIRFRLEDGTSLVKAVTTVEGETNTRLTFTAAILFGNPMPKPGDLWMFGPLGLETRELIIKDIAIEPDLSAKLTLIDHAPAVHDADTGTIPPYTSGITTPPVFTNGPELPIIEHIVSDDTVMVRDPDGSLRARMVIYLRPQSGLRPIGVFSVVRTRIRADPPSTTVGPWHTRSPVPIANNSVAVDDVEEGITYQIRLRTVTADGRASAWTDIVEHTIVGKSRPPPDVQEFEVTRLPDGTRRYAWDLGTIPPDIAGVLIRFKRNEAGDPLAWEDLDPLHTGILEGASPTLLPDPPDAGAYTFGIKMVDTSGLESENAVIVNATLGPGPSENIAVSFDARESGWPGTKEGCHIGSPDRYLWSTGTETWDTLPATWDDWDRWIVTPTTPIRYTHPIIDLGLSFQYEPLASVDYAGTATVEFRHGASSAAVLAAAWAPLTDFAGRNIASRFCQYRITVAADASNEVPVIRRLSMLFRAQQAQQFINDLFTVALEAPYRIGPGDFRAPITEGLFAVVRSVNLSFNGTGQGWTWEIVDKSILPGPRIRIYNAAGQPADAKVDIIVRGFAAGVSPQTLIDEGAKAGNPLVTYDFSNRDRSGWIPIA